MYKVEFCLSCSDPLICFHSLLCCTFMTINMLLCCCCESTLIFKVDPHWWYIHTAYFCTRHLACIHATAPWFSVHNFIIFCNVFVSLSLENLHQRIVEWRDKFQAHRHWSLISRPSSFSSAWWPRGPNDFEHSVWDQVSYRSRERETPTIKSPFSSHGWARSQRTREDTIVSSLVDWDLAQPTI